jgi:hypothetical protein
VVTPEGIAAVDGIMKENRCITVNEIAAYLDICHGLADSIVREVLLFICLFIYLWFSFESPSFFFV